MRPCSDPPTSEGPDDEGTWYPDFPVTHDDPDELPAGVTGRDTPGSSRARFSGNKDVVEGARNARSPSIAGGALDTTTARSRLDASSTTDSLRLRLGIAAPSTSRRRVKTVAATR